MFTVGTDRYRPVESRGCETSFRNVAQKCQAAAALARVRKVCQGSHRFLATFARFFFAGLAVDAAPLEAFERLNMRSQFEANCFVEPVCTVYPVIFRTPERQWVNYCEDSRRETGFKVRPAGVSSPRQSTELPRLSASTTLMVATWKQA